MKQKDRPQIESAFPVFETSEERGMQGQYEGRASDAKTQPRSVRCKSLKIRKRVDGRTLEKILERRVSALMQSAALPQYRQGDTAPLMEEQSLSLLCRKTGEIIDIAGSLKVGSNAAFADYVPVDNPTVSKKHAVFTKKQNLLFIEDLGSSNGTKINGVRLPEGIVAQIREGDTVVLSNEVFIVQNQ